ncbi:hypothetical protein [Virgibacillus pantothenticus]|nr:hypothetical protein [Virgibacillus pantothenticus]
MSVLDIAGNIGFINVIVKLQTFYLEKLGLSPSLMAEAFVFLIL